MSATDAIVNSPPAVGQCARRYARPVGRCWPPGTRSRGRSAEAVEIALRRVSSARAGSAGLFDGANGERDRRGALNGIAAGETPSLATPWCARTRRRRSSARGRRGRA